MKRAELLALMAAIIFNGQLTSGADLSTAKVSDAVETATELLTLAESKSVNLE